MSHTDARKAMTVCSCASFVCCLLGLLAEAVEPALLNLFGGLAITFAIGAYVLYLLYWRCPHCGKHLPIRGVGRLDFCPYCGNGL